MFGPVSCCGLAALPRTGAPAMVRGGLALPHGAVLATLASLIDELHGSIHGLHWACIDSAESLSLSLCIFYPPWRRIATMSHHRDFAIVWPWICVYLDRVCLCKARIDLSLLAVSFMESLGERHNI